MSSNTPNNFNQRFTLILAKAKPWQIIVFTVLFAVVQVAGASLLIHGYIRKDFMATALFVATTTAYIIIKTLLALQEQIQISEQEAIKANRYKSAFLLNASHDIRTPLNAIIGFTDLLKETELNVEQSEYVQHIGKSNQMLQHLIDDVLELNKVESGSLEIVESTFSPKQMLDEVHAIMLQNSHFANKSSVELLAPLVEKDVPAWVHGPVLRIQQILLNLISNALKFTSEGLVRFGIRPIGPGVYRFYVQDTGNGIPKEMHELIFEPFYQIETNQPERGSSPLSRSGFGLGLSICKQLLHRMDSILHLTSNLSGSNRGSIFYFDIRLTDASVVAPQPDQNANDSRLATQVSAGTAQGDVCLLLVEDNEINVKLAQIVLTQAGYFVYIARNGLEAIHLWQNHPEIALILMDLHMPQMDGKTATAQIRALEKQRDTSDTSDSNQSNQHHVPIVVFSASTTSEEITLAHQAGCDDYISKPLDKVKLIETIRKHLTHQPHEPHEPHGSEVP